MSANSPLAYAIDPDPSDDSAPLFILCAHCYTHAGVVLGESADITPLHKVDMPYPYPGLCEVCGKDETGTVRHDLYGEEL